MPDTVLNHCSCESRSFTENAGANCGIGPEGFEQGNQCAKDAGGSHRQSLSRSGRDKSPPSYSLKTADRIHKGFSKQEFELKTMSLGDVTPSQSGEDYENASSKHLSKHISKYDSTGRKEDYDPILVDENLKILDGNHRHAARKMAGLKKIDVWVPKKRVSNDRQTENVFCATGEGGGVDPSCGKEGGKSVREHFGTRTPAMKQRIKTVEHGPVGFLANRTPEEALQEIAQIKELHTKDLEHLKRVADAKEELTGVHEQSWRHAEALAGRTIRADEWAKTLGVPQKESYVRQLQESEDAIKWLVKQSNKKKSVDNESPEYQTLVSNFSSGKIRREKQGGREFIVAPMTMIVSGVLNGSRGPLYYPPEEVGKNPHIWNGMPILCRHPINGNSGRDPQVWNEQGIGTVYFSKYGNGKLTAEAWVDVDNCTRIDKRIIESLLTNGKLELSTGLYGDFEEVSGDYNGVPYKFVVRNIGADHLAILPDQTGACSLRDGCGVNNSSNLILNKLKDFIELIENGEVSSEKACQILEDGTAQGHPLTDDQKKFFGAKCGQKTENAFCPTGKGGGVDPTCGKDGGGSSEDHEEVRVDQLKKGDISIGPHGDEYEIGKIEDDPDEEGSRRITMVKKNGKPVTGRGADFARFDSVWKIKKRPTNNQESQDETDTGSSVTNEEEPEMAKLKDTERKSIIDNLVKNEAWKDSQELLGKMSDAQLQSLAPKKVENCGGDMKQPEAPPADNVPVEDEEEEAFPPKKPVANAKKSVSLAEYLAATPEELKPIIQNALKSQMQEKQRLIKQIVENESNEFSEDQLKKMDVDMLRPIANLAKGKKPAETEEEAIYNFIGAAGGPVEMELPRKRYQLTEKEKKGSPIMNVDWEAESKSHDSKFYSSVK